MGRGGDIALAHSGKLAISARNLSVSVVFLTAADPIEGTIVEDDGSGTSTLTLQCKPIRYGCSTNYTLSLIPTAATGAAACLSVRVGSTRCSWVLQVDPSSHWQISSCTWQTSSRSEFSPTLVMQCCE